MAIPSRQVVLAVLNFKLLSANALVDAQREDTRVQSVFYGALVALLGYNLLVALSIRSRTYALYVGYLCAYTLVSVLVGGYGIFALLPALSLLNLGVPIGTALVGFFSLNFSVALLAPDSKSRLRRAAVLLGNGYVPVALAVAPFGFVACLRVVFAGVPFWAFILIALGVDGMRTGSTTAKLYVAAWSSFIAGTIVNVLRTFAVLPVTWLTVNAMQVGSAIEFIALSLALAQRIKDLQSMATANAELAARNAIAAEEASNRALAEQERANSELQRVDKLKDEFLAVTSRKSGGDRPESLAGRNVTR